MLAIAITLLLLHKVGGKNEMLPVPDQVWWKFQSIDTMKYSRDLAKVVLHDPSFDAVIDDQMKRIASTGVTHVAIATPYDEEFYPVLKRWASAARKYHLNIWFRGNWSGWEGWFGYSKITREEHIEKTKKFILNHPDIFIGGDVFSTCPECENGGPGDPRQNKDTDRYRAFLIDEYQASRAEFQQIGKNVAVNFDSMNGDVAKLIMDKETTKQLGGIVVIDHYVASVEDLERDIREIAQKSGGKIILGEFGAPIEDVHGKMKDDEQSHYIDRAFTRLANMPEVVGINYWVGFGGSTALWHENGEEKKSVAIIRSFFKPELLSGEIINANGKPINNAKIFLREREFQVDRQGKFYLPYVGTGQTFLVDAKGYVSKEIKSPYDKKDLTITLENVEHESLVTRFKRFFFGFLGH